MSVDQERSDLINALALQRRFLRRTVDGLTDDQARLTPTVSALSLGGLFEHVARTEATWMRFAVGGAAAMYDPEFDYETQFRMGAGKTLSSVLERYDAVAQETERLATTLELDAAHPLPEAPYFPPGASWTVRRVLVHILAETAQHAGHADIIREAIDGQKTMG